MNGSWSQWSSWQPCSVTCGGGNRTRARTCSKPAPKWNGMECPGTNISTESCNLHKCKGRCLCLNFLYFLMCISQIFFDLVDGFYLTTRRGNRFCLFFDHLDLVIWKHKLSRWVRHRSFFGILSLISLKLLLHAISLKLLLRPILFRSA